MGKHSRSGKYRSWIGGILLAAVCLVAASVALWSFVLSPGDGLVRKADNPSISNAPKPADNPPPAKPALVAVPKISSDIGRDKAAKLLKNKNLELGDVKDKSSTDVDKGKVMSQSPKAGKKVKKGSAVGITLSTGPKEVAVPDIPYGATKEEATKLLKSKNLKLGDVKEQSSTDVDKGGVMLQDPLPNKKVKEGSAVGITLSSGSSAPDQASTATDTADPGPAPTPSNTADPGPAPTPSNTADPGPAPTPSNTADPGSAPTPSSSAMTLTVPAMGKSGQPIGEGVDEATLQNGAGHAPTSGYPWIPGSNTYIAGHVLGYSGTGSYMDFAALPNMSYGDTITITDANGTNYNYTVSEILQVSIYDTWVMAPTGKDQISLQTCINPPAYDVRLVVRGDLTSVS